MNRETAMAKNSKGLRARWARRSERGAGGLLPIVVIGVLIITIAASMAASTSFAAKVSGGQVAQINKEIEAKSLINSFVSDIQAVSYTSNPKGNATIDGAGTYRVYYSKSATRPSSSSESGVVFISTNGIPTDARWLLVELDTKTSGRQIAVFSYLKKAGPTFETAISWSGPVKLTDSNVRAAPGTMGPVSVVTRESASTATTQSLTASGSTVAADIYATYTTTQTGLSAGTVRGNLYSKSKVNLTNTPKVLGSVISASSVNGTADIAGARTSNSTALPTPPGQNPMRVSLPGDSISLAATDCSTAAKLKAKLESFTTTVFIPNGDVCAASSWATEIKPNAKIIVNSSSTTANLSISGLTVSGSKGSLGFASNFGLVLSNVNYTSGATGQLISSGNATLTGSTFNGSITSVGTKGGTLDIGTSTVLYTPVDAPNACFTTSCSATTAWSSAANRLVQVS